MRFLSGKLPLVAWFFWGSARLLPCLDYDLIGRHPKIICGFSDITSLLLAIYAVAAGADIVGTTLYGYTEATKNLPPPSFSFLEELVNKLSVPVICSTKVITKAFGNF